MRILLIVTEKLPVPAIRGGAIQTYIDGITPLIRQNHNITILGVRDPALPRDEVQGGVRYVRIPGRIFDIYQKGVARFLQSNQFDLIHIFNRPRLVNPVRRAAPRSRIILSMHNDMFLPEKIEQKEAIQAISEVERIVTVSNYVGRRIVEAFPQASDKLRTIYSGVDIDRYAPAQSGHLQSVRDKIRHANQINDREVILFVGRLSPKKGADILVRSMWTLAKSHPNSTLVLVGSKWYSDDRVSDYVGYVRALAARSPIPVITTGFVEPGSVHEWFWAGDLFVCPSQWQEPLARVHYEAMAAGLPIVTTARGGNPEVMEPGRNGVIVDHPEEPMAFAQKIGELLSNRALRRSMGDHGRALARQRYGWDRVGLDVLNVWEDRG